MKKKQYPIFKGPLQIGRLHFSHLVTHGNGHNSMTYFVHAERSAVESALHPFIFTYRVPVFSFLFYTMDIQDRGNR